ncbi:hypothetical protein COO59_12165 [Mixta theicola]|uniref:Uncharacterized protein n=1 Tax=Mixta theicola TaxID=1458355 RepID=A0A2K1Q8M7_9GAMM|nr:hypothetical protein [Mixta theicola]PNS11378.1 hypothetical protein COO59_12165 [Mixta theicola]
MMDRPERVQLRGRVMSGKKIVYFLLFIIITAGLVSSRVLLGFSDILLVFVDRTCRASSVQCTAMIMI